MEVTVKTNDLAQVLRLAQAVTERRTTIPVLGTILLTAESNGLVVTGTDLELGVVFRCPAQIKQPGSLAVPAQRLTEYVKMLPEGDLFLREQASNWLALSCGRSKSRIAGVLASSYPELPSVPEKGVDLSCGTLAHLAEKVIFAISHEQSQLTLTGALLQITSSRVTMVATDGHRLALATNHAELPDLEQPVQVLIPRKALVAFLRIAEGRNDQMIRCSFTENHLFFAWSEQLLLSRKLSGAFPDYERVLPHQHDRSVSLERNELRASVERVSRFSDNQSRCIVFDISPGQLLVRAEESNVGQSEEAIAVNYEKQPVQIGLSSLYVSEFLARAEYETVRFFFRDGLSAAEWRPETPAETAAYRYVVMPMAIR